MCIKALSPRASERRSDLTSNLEPGTCSFLMLDARRNVMPTSFAARRRKYDVHAGLGHSRELSGEGEGSAELDEYQIRVAEKESAPALVHNKSVTSGPSYSSSEEDDWHSELDEDEASNEFPAQRLKIGLQESISSVGAGAVDTTHHTVNRRDDRGSSVDTRSTSSNTSENKRATNMNYDGQHRTNQRKSDGANATLISSKSGEDPSDSYTSASDSMGSLSLPDNEVFNDESEYHPHGELGSSASLLEKNGNERAAFLKEKDIPHVNGDIDDFNDESEYHPHGNSDNFNDESEYHPHGELGESASSLENEHGGTSFQRTQHCSTNRGLQANIVRRKDNSLSDDGSSTYSSSGWTSLSESQTASKTASSSSFMNWSSQDGSSAADAYKQKGADHSAKGRHSTSDTFAKKLANLPTLQKHSAASQPLNARLQKSSDVTSRVSEASPYHPPAHDEDDEEEEDGKPFARDLDTNDNKCLNVTVLGQELLEESSCFPEDDCSEHASQDLRQSSHSHYSETSEENSVDVPSSPNFAFSRGRRINKSHNNIRGEANNKSNSSVRGEIVPRGKKHNASHGSLRLAQNIEHTQLGLSQESAYLPSDDENEAHVSSGKSSCDSFSSSSSESDESVENSSSSSLSLSAAFAEDDKKKMASHSGARGRFVTKPQPKSKANLVQESSYLPSDCDDSQSTSTISRHIISENRKHRARHSNKESSYLPSGDEESTASGTGESLASVGGAHSVVSRQSLDLKRASAKRQDRIGRSPYIADDGLGEETDDEEHADATDDRKPPASTTLHARESSYLPSDEGSVSTSSVSYVQPKRGDSSKYGNGWIPEESACIPSDEGSSSVSATSHAAPAKYYSRQGFSTGQVGQILEESSCLPSDEGSIGLSAASRTSATTRASSPLRDISKEDFLYKKLSPASYPKLAPFVGQGVSESGDSSGLSTSSSSNVSLALSDAVGQSAVTPLLETENNNEKSGPLYQESACLPSFSEEGHSGPFPSGYGQDSAGLTLESQPKKEYAYLEQDSFTRAISLRHLKDPKNYVHDEEDEAATGGSKESTEEQDKHDESSSNDEVLESATKKDGTRHQTSLEVQEPGHELTNDGMLLIEQEREAKSREVEQNTSVVDRSPSDINMMSSNKASSSNNTETTQDLSSDRMSSSQEDGMVSSGHLEIGNSSPREESIPLLRPSSNRSNSEGNVAVADPPNNSRPADLRQSMGHPSQRFCGTVADSVRFSSNGDEDGEDDNAELDATMEDKKFEAELMKMTSEQVRRQRRAFYLLMIIMTLTFGAVVTAGIFLFPALQAQRAEKNHAMELAAAHAAEEAAYIEELIKNQTLAEKKKNATEAENGRPKPTIPFPPDNLIQICDNTLSASSPNDSRETPLYSLEECFDGCNLAPCCWNNTKPGQVDCFSKYPYICPVYFSLCLHLLDLPEKDLPNKQPSTADGNSNSTSVLPSTGVVDQNATNSTDQPANTGHEAQEQAQAQFEGKGYCGVRNTDLDFDVTCGPSTKPCNVDEDCHTQGVFTECLVECWTGILTQGSETPSSDKEDGGTTPVPALSTEIAEDTELSEVEEATHSSSQNVTETSEESYTIDQTGENTTEQVVDEEIIASNEPIFSASGLSYCGIQRGDGNNGFICDPGEVPCASKEDCTNGAGPLFSECLAACADILGLSSSNTNNELDFDNELESTSIEATTDEDDSQTQAHPKEPLPKDDPELVPLVRLSFTSELWLSGLGHDDVAALNETDFLQIVSILERAFSLQLDPPQRVGDVRVSLKQIGEIMTDERIDLPNGSKRDLAEKQTHEILQRGLHPSQQSLRGHNRNLTGRNAEEKQSKPEIQGDHPNPFNGPTDGLALTYGLTAIVFCDPTSDCNTGLGHVFTSYASLKQQIQTSVENGEMLASALKLQVQSSLSIPTLAIDPQHVKIGQPTTSPVDVPDNKVNENTDGSLPTLYFCGTVTPPTDLSQETLKCHFTNMCQDDSDCISFHSIAKTDEERGLTKGFLRQLKKKRSIDDSDATGETKCLPACSIENR